MARPAPTWAVGLMIGTSLDAVDAALVEFDEDGAVEPKGFVTTPLDPALAERVRAAAEGQALPAQGWAELEDAVTRAHEAAVRGVAPGALQRGLLRFVAAHGVTVRHAPAVGQTWQLLDGAALAARLCLPVACDFRRADVALGGQGAPLAPLADLALRASPERDRVLLNLGGIANLTALPAGATGAGEVRAGDVGPANLPLDELCRRHHHEAFDRDGALAASASPDPALSAWIEAQEWWRRPLPRSFGREEFGPAFVDALESVADLPLAVRLSTLVESEARAVAFFLEDLVGDWRARPDEPFQLLVTGGGRHNAAWMTSLARHLSDAEVQGIETIGVTADAKEAVDFAWLGWRRWRGIASDTPPLTGAARATVLGALHGGGEA